MPREIELFGFFMPTLLPIFILAFGLQWLLDSLLARLGLYSHVWHPSLFRFSLFVCLFGALGLALYR
jgi:protein AaeX